MDANIQNKAKVFEKTLCKKKKNFALFNSTWEILTKKWNVHRGLIIFSSTVCCHICTSSGSLSTNCSSSQSPEGESVLSLTLIIRFYFNIMIWKKLCEVFLIIHTHLFPDVSTFQKTWACRSLNGWNEDAFAMSITSVTISEGNLYS